VVGVCCAAVIKMRRSNSWSESYEDFAVAEESNPEPAESIRESNKDGRDKIWSVGLFATVVGALVVVRLDICLCGLQEIVTDIVEMYSADHGLHYSCFF